MVLTSQNSGKYLLRSYHEKRAEALVDPSRFTTDELARLDMSDALTVSESDDRIFQVSTQPIDPLTPSRKIDIRQPGRR